MAAMLVGLVWAPAASAASDPIASGSTTINLNKGLFKKLKRNGVKVLKIQPGRVKNRKITLPVGSGSTIDPTNGAGVLNHNGGFKFKKGKKTAALRNLVLNTSTKSLNGKIGKKRVKVASVGGLSFSRNGFGVDVTVRKLKLTGAAAKQLNKALTPPRKKGKKKGKKSSASVSKKKKAPKLFKGGQVLGSASNSVQPSTVTVQASGDATLQSDLGTVLKFADVDVDFIPIAPTTRRDVPLPLFSFPIGGGTIAPDASAGTVQTLGGVNLVQREFEVAPGVRVQLSITLGSLWVDLGTRVATAEISIDSTNPTVVPTPGAVGRSSIANVDLSGATISTDPTNRTVSVLNARATLQAVTAATLNTVFAEPILRRGDLFREGDSLGTFSFTAQTQ